MKVHQLLRTIPDAETLIALSPEELAQHLIPAVKQSHNGKCHPSQISHELFRHSDPESFPENRRQPVLNALFEAWAWLRGQALLVPTDGTSGEWCRLSRRADELDDPTAFAEYRAANFLPRAILHPSINEVVWLKVMRKEYDVAVFQAMKAVEIAVRDASGIDELGVKLMRKAFHPDTGPLTDQHVEMGERQARADLFAGAIGSYKNPVSHREVPLNEAAEVIEQVMLASHLLRIVDTRREALAS